MAQDISAVEAKVQTLLAANSGKFYGIEFECKANKGGLNINISNLKTLGGQDSAKMRALLSLEDILADAEVPGVNVRLSQQRSEKQEDGSWKTVGYTQWPHIFVDCRERLSDTVAALAETMAAKDAQIERLLAALEGKAAPVVEEENTPDPF